MNEQEIQKGIEYAGALLVTDIVIADRAKQMGLHVAEIRAGQWIVARRPGAEQAAPQMNIADHCCVCLSPTCGDVRDHPERDVICDGCCPHFRVGTDGRITEYRLKDGTWKKAGPQS